MSVCDTAAAQPQAGGSGYYLQDGIIVSAGLGEAGEDAMYPACDGRALLMVRPSGRPVRFSVPGACPSLRAQVDGHKIYPVYLDYGSDVDAMCRAKATYGGNGRILSNAAEYVDPCS